MTFKVIKLLLYFLLLLTVFFTLSKVLATTFDGASVNRRLVKIHDLKAKFTYKVNNIHSPDERDLFFTQTLHT